MHKEVRIGTLLEGKIPESHLTYKEWQRLKLPDGKDKTRMYDVEQTGEEFSATMMDAFAAFTQHVQRVKEQYSAIGGMKEKLSSNPALVYMDLAENYTVNLQKVYNQPTGIPQWSLFTPA